NQFPSLWFQWDLVCGRAGLSALSQTIFMLGQGVGAFICTSLADKYGRRPIHLITQGGLLVSCIAIVFINNIGGFIVLRFIVGAMQQSVALTGYAILVEMLITDLRPLAGCLNGLSWTISLVALAPLGYLLQHFSWRYFQVTIIVVMSYAVLMICFMDESLRWLVANNKIQQAEDIISKMCKANKTEFSKSRLALHQQMAKAKTKNELEMVMGKWTPVNELQLLKPKAINSVTYYGLFLTSSNLSGNRFFNYFLNAVVELPSLLFVFIAVKRLDRRSVCGISMIISGVALIISGVFYIPGDKSAGSTSSVVFSLIGKFAITASFHGLFIYTPELFPTNMRNAGLGVGSSAARIGGMVAPFSRLLSDVVIWGPRVVFSGGCLLAAILITLLPETRGRPLLTTIEEMRAWKNIKSSTLELSIK
ncbi:hypothetical protein LOTGIDRAFT_126895, partial [Lottia gigantea]